MMKLKTYSYTEIEAIPYGLLPGRVTELRSERFTVVTELGKETAVLKGTFYYSTDYSEYARNKTFALWSKQMKQKGGW